MTKRVKRFISLFLAFLMIAGISTTNAFSAYETIEREDTHYKYAGEFGLGRQTVKDIEWGDEVSNYYVYYSFIAEHDGYYSFTYNEMWNSTECRVCNKQNYDTELSYTYSMDSSEQNLTKIYYFEAGEYFFFVDLHWSMVDVNITAEYFGEKVSEIKFKHDLLLDCDCFYYSYSDPGTNFIIDANATIHTLSYYVKDVEVSNIDYYLENAVEYYNYYDIEYPYGETVTVTFNDGTSDSFVFSEYVNENYVTFPNGQKYAVDFWHYDTYELDGFNGYLQVDICYDTVKEFKLNGQKASFSENIRVLNEDNKYFTDEILCCWECAVNSWNNIEELSLYLSDVLLYVIEISINISDFWGYYLTLSFLK